MGLFDGFKKKKTNKSLDNKIENAYDNVERALKKEDAWIILNEEMKELFPKTGEWYKCCLNRPSNVAPENLPCHLRDNAWLAKYFQHKLSEDKIYVPSRYVKEFVQTSPEFAEERHRYELEIVKWQIESMNNGGEWILPEGYNKSDVLYSSNIDIIFREGVVNTLLTIGMDKEVVEEGIEANANLWRSQYMKLGFINEYNPINRDRVAPEPTTKEFEDMWFRLREFEYYRKHKESVEKYGKPTRNMTMSLGEAKEISSGFEDEARKRMWYLASWAEHAPYKTKKHQRVLPAGNDGGLEENSQTEKGE